MYDHKFAVQTQVYGPEARGGASMSAVIIDDEEVLHPKVAVPDIFVIMSQEGFEKSVRQPGPSDITILDSTLVHSRPVIDSDLGNSRSKDYARPGYRGKYRDARSACRVYARGKR